jgi:vacuolar-type H+-ATPase subunit H
MADSSHAAAHPPFDAAASQATEGSPAGDRSSEIVRASAKVARIVEAAERAAEELRRGAEQRARERIAEADRAAGLRVEAAEEEARDIVGEARRQAAGAQAEARSAVTTVHERAAEVRAEAEQRRLQAIAGAQAEVSQLVQEAEEQATELRGSARAEARDVLDDAHYAAREVVREGERLTGDLRELSQSLVRNADKLMRDVQLVHGQLVSRLDAVVPPGAPPHVPAQTIAAPPGRSFEEPSSAARARGATPQREPGRSASDHDEGRGGRSARGAAKPLPAEITGRVPTGDTSFDVPEFVNQPRRRR